MELYISVDIESDGPIPGRNSMLSFGAAAFDMDAGGVYLEGFSANLNQLEEATPNQDTMDWWKTQPEAWKACRENTKDPKEAMTSFVEWVDGLCKKLSEQKKKKVSAVFVGYPAGFDFTFMYWYMQAFVGRSPFSFSALDIKSYAMAVLGTNFRQTTKRRFPKRWFSKRPHTHVALDDAIEQGELFCNILRESRK